MPTKLGILLINSADGIYYPGQEVIGDVIVTLGKSCTVSSEWGFIDYQSVESKEPFDCFLELLLTICGVGKSKFYDQEKARKGTFRGKERYLNSELVLYQPYGTQLNNCT